MLGGGGFFFAPFHYVDYVGSIAVQCPGGGYGAWSHGAIPLILPHPARYIQVNINNPSAVGVYYFKIGVGAAGSESAIVPSDGNSIEIDWSVPPPWTYSFIFPSSLRAGTEISANGYIFVGLLETATVSIYTFS